ncbi:hypothetical protein Poli38472_014274 [Pythium oligandrum]|uniref:Uncharacterized protein n=1 Tax=Pythium oligandrum TaxID=41045 RepID=A0A8K1FLT3_PYTOL|nr:hypothetical protein Poli38472_014274 [Pythium oligandrum]|eukprot:TMW64157.1 hypothetical protein Poli38472_014274 [Pythium oligandrum]
MATMTMENLLNKAKMEREEAASPDAKRRKTDDASPKKESVHDTPENENEGEVDAEAEAEAEENAATMMPKLPPISTLTRPSRLPPSLQATKETVTSSQSSNTPTPPVQNENLCRYRNKLCLHPRAIKRNGELHNLCEKHRAKANQNQRKLESKRRMQKRQTRHTLQPVPPRGPPLAMTDPAVVLSTLAASVPYAVVPRGAPSGAALPSLAQLHPPPPHPSYHYYRDDYPPYSH